MKRGRPFCMRAITEKRSCRWQCDKCADSEWKDLLALAVVFILMFAAAAVVTLDRELL